ncbi:sensor histidine kinase [Actinoplanes sichuanensis]|uniref:Sensor-like histidine kinase SenX3 n=1 Tax=Actinoplanes sichuanensis TaxID=512349 RepID=A0ABW4AJW1_9ACTN|nr:ATP-binding protein [Actinoplanes sichuanensis]
MERKGSILALSGVVLFLTVAAALALAAGQVLYSRAEADFARKSEVIERSVTAEIERYRVALADVAAAASVPEKVDAAAFADLTEPLTRRRLPGAAAVNLVVAAATADVPTVQRRWRALGDPALRLRPVGAGQHFFSVLSRPLDDRPPRLGVDAAKVPEARDVLLRAQNTGQMAISRAYRLLRDSELPVAEQQLSFVLAAPVARNEPTWVVMAFRGTDFLREAIGLAAGDEADVTLSEFGTSVVTVAEWRPERVDDALPGYETTIDVPQRAWQLDIRPTVSLLPPTGVGLQVTATIIGTVLALVLAVPISVLWIARERAARQVIRATDELRADIHRREQIEHELRMREVELVGFAGVVAHDLRAPLAMVTGYVEVLRDETAGLLTEDHRVFLDRLQAGTHRMHSMLEDLLAYATADSMPLRATEVDLSGLVAEIVGELCAAPSALPPHIQVGEMPRVVGDPTLLRQIFYNLVGNAVKYTEPGAPATVEISAVQQGPSAYRVEIADRGIGIPPDQRAHVFDPFIRVAGSERFPGTGLGLAIVRRVVERHGGRIDVDGNIGGGSRFRFTLPAAPAAPTRTEGPEMAGPSALSSRGHGD